MFNFFGGGSKKEQTIPQQPSNNNVQQPQIDLGQHSKSLDTKVQDLTKTIDNLDVDIAKMYQQVKNSRGSQQTFNKQKCVQLLKKKKMYEGQINQLMQQQMSIDEMQFNKEAMQQNQQNALLMRDALKQQQKEFEKIDMDELEDLQDEMLDMQFEQKYMNEVMSRNYNLDVDEDDLDRELEDLDDQMFNEVLNNANQGHVPKYVSEIQDKNQQLKDFNFN